MNDKKLRRRARALALQALYAAEFNRGGSTLCEDAGNQDILQFAWLDREPGEGECFMARTLTEAVWQNCVEIDQVIAGHLQNWTLDRLLNVDRNILRLGVYMLRFLPGTPVKVAIDECVELCHSFASEQSYRLINGVLHNVAQKYRANSEENPEAE